MADQACSNSSSRNEELSDSEGPRKRQYYRKFRSVKGKKRKGFAGLKKGACIRSENTEDVGLTGDEDRQPSTASNEALSQKTESDNCSATFYKLMNTSFDSDSCGPTTRSMSGVKEIGTSSSSGNILMDKNLLLEAINNSVICRACRNPKAKLNLLFSNKFGLAERYNFSCRSCSTTTLLETSKKLDGSQRADKKGGQASYEVNCRAVLASLETGLAGL